MTALAARPRSMPRKTILEIRQAFSDQLAIGRMHDHPRLCILNPEVVVVTVAHLGYDIAHPAFKGEAQHGSGLTHQFARLQRLVGVRVGPGGNEEQAEVCQQGHPADGENGVYLESDTQVTEFPVRCDVWSACVTIVANQVKICMQSELP